LISTRIWSAGSAISVGPWDYLWYRIIARLVIDACGQCDLRVPKDVAIVSVDNERTICEHCEPQLTSVDRNALQVGYQAARLLDSQMCGCDAEAGEILIPPGELVLRASTDTLAVDDPRLREAMAYIQSRLAGDLSIDEILAHTKMSRRWLEYAFRKHLGDSPHTYITRQRVAAAKRLLEETPGMKLHEVAATVGFSRPKQLTLAFQKFEGKSPRQYRQSLDA